MKETKTAEFKNVVVGAQFDSGKLVGLHFMSVTPSGSDATLDATETLDLTTWLNTALQMNPYLLFPNLGVKKVAGEAPVASGQDVKPVPIDANDPLNPPAKAGLTDLPKIEDRTTSKIILPGNEKKISDAESVKNRISIEKALAASGMVMESKVVAPIQVRIEK